MKPTLDDIQVTKDHTGFADAIASIKSAHGPRGVTVDNYGDQGYAESGATFFHTPDKRVVGLVKPTGEIASVASHPHGPWKGAAEPLLQKMKQHGGKFLDNFDTYLTPIYRKNGFEVVGRAPFNKEFAPDGWDHPESPIKDAPDIVFMSLKDDAPRLSKLIKRVGAKDYPDIQRIVNWFYNRKTKLARKDTYTLYHYSPHIIGDEGTVDPKQFAKNPWTQAEKRALRTPRSFFYLSPKDREFNWFGAKTPVYTTEVPKEHIYDFDVDPLNIKVPGTNLETMIRKVRGKKYKGIKYSGTGFPIVAMFEPLKVVKLSRFGVPPIVDSRRPGNAKHVYAWVKPDGEVIHVPASQHHRDVAKAHGFGSSDHAMQNGWLRISSAGATLDGMNHVVPPNLKQLRALKDLAIQAQYDSASINDRTLRLSRSWLRQSAKDNQVQGWIEEDGTFHPLTNDAVLHTDLAQKLGYKDTEGAYDKGLAHVAIAGSRELSINHPRGFYTPAQLRKFKELARSRNFDATLTLKSGDRLKTVPVKLARQEFLGGWITPEGDYHENVRYNGHAETVHRVLKPKSRINEYDEARKRGWVHVADQDYDGILGIHHDDFKYTPLQIMKAKELARKHGFDKIEMVTKGLQSRVIQLARQAPQGGVVVNNEFYVGGRFLPRVFESIRKVRERKRLKLSREPWEMTRDEYEKESPDLPNRVTTHRIGGKNVDVIVNPDLNDLGYLRKKAREVFPGATSGTWVRYTRDTKGNKFAWMAHEATHDQMEPVLSKHYGREMNQNSTKPVHRYEVLRAIQEGKPVPPKVLEDYPGTSPQTQGTARTSP